MVLSLIHIYATHIILYTGKNNKAISGQPQNIVGTVIDESGEPIIGANVMVEGTSAGVITDVYKRQAEN